MSDKLTPKQIAQKAVDNTINATGMLIEGVKAVKVAPSIAAAAAENRMVAGVQEAVRSGKFRENTLAVNLSSWQASMIDKGVPRIAGGVTAAQVLIERFHTQRQPFQEGIDSDLERMPKGTLQQSIARMTHQVTAMSKFRFKRAG